MSILKKITHIKNPLTVIAIFSAVAEISGTTVLPFIAERNQSIYIWFLMLFPTLIVVFFFITLNWNHKVLYAPSDYKNEDNFLKSLRSATTDEKIEKFKEEIGEVTNIEKSKKTDNLDSNTSIHNQIDEELIDVLKPSDSNAEFNGATTTEAQENSSEKIAPTDLKNGQNKIATLARQGELLANYALAEKLSILKLSKELGFDFKNDVRVETNDGDYVIFDALAVKNNVPHGIQIKLFQNTTIEVNQLRRTFDQMRSIAKNDDDRFIFHFVAVLDNPTLIPSRVKEKLLILTSRYPFNINIHIFKLSDLKNEYQYGF